MPPATRCPDARDLERLLLGQVADGEAEALESHLRDCPACLETIRTAQARDTLVEAVRGQKIDPDADNDTTLASLIGRVKEMCPPAPSGPSLTLRALNPPQGPGEIGRLAHYRVLKVLGEGGMGVVFLAEDVRLGRPVALKTMKPEIAADPRHRQRFLREARAAAKVEDDHIVPIYDVGEDRGVPWLAMPFLKGQSLDELLKRVKVLKPAQAARLAAQVAKGLAAAHAAGLIHRDVKPANIWVEPEGGGRAKLLDFGLARDQSPERERGEPLTHSGAVVGTPAFMAPEQARGEALDGRADLFGLGCVLYRAVTGRLPFHGRGMMDTLVALATQTPPAPHEVNPDVPPPLSALIMRLLAKDRSARPASASAVAAGLEALQERPAAPAPVAMPVAIPAEPRREERNPWADLTEVTDPPAPTAAPVAAPRPQWRRLAAAALLLALGGVLAAGIIVIIKDKSGKEVARVTVPEGGSAEIKQDGGRGKPKIDPAGANPDRRAAQWVHSLGGTIRIRQDGQESDIGPGSALPAAPFELVVAGIHDNPKVDDAGLAHLEGLTHLTDLYLAGTKVSDAGLLHLKGLTTLTTLDIHGTQASDAGLVHLKAMTNLRQLLLDHTRVSDAGLEHLQGLTKLTWLGLAATRVTDAGLEHLKGLTNLETLLLDSTQVGDAGLEHFKGLTKLTRLGLYGTRVSDDGLVHVKGLTSLALLDLQDTKVSDAGLVHLKGLNITALLLSRTKVSDAGLEHLKGLTNLQMLALGATQVGDAGLENLKGLTNLTDLSLNGTRVSDAGLVHLKRLTRLKFLVLNLTQVTDAGLENVKGLTNLMSLNLNETRVGDAGLVHLKGLTKLVYLYLEGTRVSDAGLGALVHLPLGDVHLTNSRVSARGFANLRSALPGGGTVSGEPRPSAAEDLLAAGATLVLRAGDGKEGRLIKKAAELPRQPFLVLRADCAGVKKPPVELLARMGDPREYEFEQLEALDLSGCAIDKLDFAPRLQSIRELNLSGTAVTDEALKALEGLPNLRKLDLNQTGVTGRGLHSLAKLPKLADLSLAGSKVSGLFAEEVGALTKLERLSLAGCTFGDAGLKHLAGLSKLTHLDLTGTQVTADGVAALQKALPKCKIVSGPAAK